MTAIFKNGKKTKAENYRPISLTSVPGKLLERLIRDEIVKHMHYANMSVQYTAIFHGCKNGNFQMKFFDIFLIFAQNIDREYTLEPPH